MALSPAMMRMYLDKVKLDFTLVDADGKSDITLTLTTTDADKLGDMLKPSVEISCQDPNFLGWSAEMLRENIEDTDWEYGFNHGHWGDVRISMEVNGVLVDGRPDVRS